jgi:hypothetical protein
MSAALKTRQPAPVAAVPPAPALPARLEATAQILDFEPGLYSVEILSAETTRAREGLVLPCLKLEPITPFSPGAGRAFVAALSEGGVLAPGAHPTYVRAEGGKASVLLTIYKVAGARVAPELRVRMIGPAAELPLPKPSIVPAPAAADSKSVPLTVIAHIERMGDVVGKSGEWVGKPGSGAAIEGFMIKPGGELRDEDIEYQAVLGPEWNTPWMRGGEFCGSRGMSLHFLGLRIRLIGRASKRFSCTYRASFVGRGALTSSREEVLTRQDGAAMEAININIIVQSRPVSYGRLRRNGN